MPTQTTFELLLKAKPWTLKPVENKRDQIKNVHCNKTQVQELKNDQD